MKKFQPNSDLYNNFYDGYTSSDEFIAKKRVHTTNEIPPLSIYKNLHSMLQRDFWKNLVGDTEIIYDKYYNLDTDGKETFDKNGDPISMSVAKYTNGIRSLNYGPIPRLVWNKNWKKDYENYLQQVKDGEAFDEGKTANDFKYIVDNSETKYNRFEVIGVFEPQKDLMLHEGYRYLSCIYPDHPDYLNILTKNEFDDKIDDSACLIDYKIDIHFMDWLPKYFEYIEGINKQIAQEDEAAKLKIRNLKNYAFNRKFFGAKEGYKMFAASAFQHASVYSASQYIPLEGGNVSSFGTPKNVDITWFKEFFDQPEEFTNSNVDKGHYLYKKLFRNIDWQNSSYDFINRYKEPTPFYGTAYPTPNSRFILYEYPNERVIDTLDKQEGRSIDDLYGTIRADFKEGQKIKVNGQKQNWEEGSYKEGHISYITSETYYKVKAILGYNKNGDYMPSESGLEEHHIDSAITVVNVDTPLQPLYKNFSVYPSNGKILQLISDHDNNPELIKHDKGLPVNEKWAIHKSNADVMLPYFESLTMEQPFYNSTITLDDIYDNIKEELTRFNEIPEIKKAKLTLDPHQDGCMYLTPQQQITEFDEMLNISLNTDEWFDGDNKNPKSRIIYGSTNISDKAFLKEGDYLISEDKKYISTVLGLSKAYLQFSLKNSSDYETLNRKVKEINNETTAKYGLVFSLSKNNSDAFGKKVIVFGKPLFHDVTQSEDNPREFSTKGVYFELKAIPTVKNHEQLKFIYQDSFKSISEKKYKAIIKLYKNSFESIDDTFAKDILNNLKTLTADFIDLDERISKTYKAILSHSIYYNDDSIKLFDEKVKKVISDLAERPILKTQAEAVYNPFSGLISNKIADLIKKYRNTCKYDLFNFGNNTVTELSSINDVFTSTLETREGNFNSDVNALNKTHENILNTLYNEHATNTANINTNHKNILDNLSNEHATIVNDININHENTLNDLSNKHATNIADINTNYENALNKLSNEHEAIVNDINTNHENTLNNLSNEHTINITTIETNHTNSINTIETNHSETLETLRITYINTLSDAYNIFNTTLVDSYNFFYDSLDKISKADIEAITIKENLKKYYTELRGYLDDLKLKIDDNTQIFGSEDWTRLKEPLDNLLVWFHRHPESKDAIIRDYNNFMTVSEEATNVYTTSYDTEIEEYNELILKENQLYEQLLTEENERYNKLVSEENQLYEQLIAEEDERYNKKVAIQDILYKRFIKKENIRYNRFVSKENAIYEQLSKEEDERYSKLVSEENAIYEQLLTEEDKRYSKVVETENNSYQKSYNAITSIYENDIKEVINNYVISAKETLNKFNQTYSSHFREYTNALNESEEDTSEEIKNIKELFNDISEKYNNIETTIESGKSITESLFEEFINSFTAYCDFLILNVGESDLEYFTIEDFKAHYNDKLNEFIKIEQDIKTAIEEYKNEFYYWFVEELAIYFENTLFYNDILNINSQDAEVSNASAEIIDCDNILFREMAPNKAFLLAPLPEDLLLRDTLDGEYSYSLLTEQDEFNCIVSFKTNKYDDLLELEEETIFGNKGLLSNCMPVLMPAWDFGTINTATLAETHYDDSTYDFVTEDVALKTKEEKNFLGEYYNSSKPWLNIYNIKDPQASALIVKSYNYYDINHDIFTLMRETDATHKFAYCDPNMLEMFLIDEDKNNIRGEVINYNRVKINCHTVQDSNIITLEDRASIRKLDYITTGCQVIGKTVNDDTYVEAINLEDHSITLNKSMQITGEFVFTFLCKIQYEPDDISEDFYNYRITASKNKEVSNNSILEHGAIDTFEYGEVSNYMLSSYIDFAVFREALTDNLQEQPYYKENFNLLVRNFYNRYLGTARENDVFVKPSMIENEDDIFFELNAYNLLGEDYIMRQEILDYFYQYLDEMTKASDDIHLGVAVNGYTLNDGEVFHGNSAFSDKNIHAKFITTDDWKDYEPFYIKIGSGCIPDIFYKKASTEIDNSDELVSRSLYNEHDDPYGSALYNSSPVKAQDDFQKKHYYDIAEPIFKARLGEYEIQKNIMFNDFSSDRVFNTIQFSVMKRIIDSFVDNNTLTIANATTSNWNGLQSWPKNCYIVDDLYIMGENGEAAELKDINFLGEWSPRIENDKIIFPEKPLYDNVLNYYVITNTHSFIVDGKEVDYKPGQIIIWENDRWNVKTFYAAGFIGDSSSASKYIVRKYDDEAITTGSNLTVTETTDFRAIILYKVLNSIGCYTNIASAANYSYSQLLELYQNALAFFKGEKTAAEVNKEVSPITLDPTCKNSFDENTCYWFEYTGYAANFAESLVNRNFKPGQFIIAIYNIDHFEVALCGISQLLFHFDNSKTYISEREYRTFFGLNSKANNASLENEVYIDRYPFLINEKIESISNTIKLRDYEDLVPGSYSSMNRVCIPFTAEGFRYLDDGSISKEKEKIFLTEDYIFSDDENKVLFTYNMIDGKPIKFAIYQEQNKYFKNIVNNVVKYSKEESLTKDGLVQNGIFTPVSGFDFSGANLSLNDRILSLKPIDIRSAYGLYLEPRLFSKYTTISGTLKGIIANSDIEERLYGKVLKWNVSHEFGTGMKEYLNRVSFASVLDNFRPNNKQDGTVYQEENLIFDTDSFEDKVISAPKITKVDVLNKISTENGVTYYKNNLIIEGTIDEKDPTVINFGSSKSIEALNNIQVGDKILEIASLTNGSNTFNQIETGLTGIRFIDYRNNKLLICADSGMKVREMTEFTLENVKKIISSTRQDYTLDGEVLTSSVSPSMLLWDNDQENWILALKETNAEVGLGMYNISFQDSNRIVLIKIEEDLEKDNDFNKFQLVDPFISENLDKLNNSNDKLISHKYGKGRMLTRDIAIREIDTTINAKPSRATVTVDYQNTNGKIQPKSPIIEYDESPRNYIELDCAVSNTTENTVLKLKKDKAYWLFDNRIGKWIFYQTDRGSEIHIGNQGKDSLNLRLYYVGYNTAKNIGLDQTFETDAWGFADATEIDDATLAQGEFLWKLPRPMNDNEIIAVQVETQASYEKSSNVDDKNKKYSEIDVYAEITGATISDVSIITKDILTIGTESFDNYEELRNKTDFDRLPYVTGPYVPYEDKSKVIRGCSSSDGHEAVLIGTNIFIKSPTKLWTSDNNKHYNPTIETEEFFWKRAKLPRFRDISHGDISKMTISEAFAKVAAMRIMILEDLETNFPTSAFYIWLKNNEVAHYETIDDIPTKISMNDVSYTITANGTRPTYFIATKDGNLVPESIVYGKALHFENYIAAEDVDLSLGYASNSYLKEQMYLSYLRDFYEIILGCNNITDMFEEGIKDIKMSDSCLIITSYNNIIMSLPFSKMTSRDDIENMNNWNMLSLNQDYEIPYCDNHSYQNGNYIYSDNQNGIVNYNYGPKLSTFFAYDLTCSYVKDDIQVYGGTLNLDNQAVSDYVNFIKELKDVDVDYSWMDKSNVNAFKNKHLFIAYSSDSGRTFTTVDLTEAGIQIPTMGSNVNAIYRIDNIIRVLYNKSSDKLYNYDILIKDDSLEESLIEKEYEESDIQYKLMNKNFYIGGGYECLINSPIEKNSFTSSVTSFIISMPGAFAGGSISTKSATSITYNPTNKYDADGGNLNIRVLLAIQTSKQIYDQFKYLDYKEDYFNMQGDLRVSESEEVLDSSTADRAFSLNETLSLAQESIYSIPSLAVDTGENGTHNIYKYNVSLKNGTDEKVYTPIPMTNFEGNDIYLCGMVSQEEGKKFLIYRNRTIGSCMTFKDILNSYNSSPDIIDNIQRMYDINSDFEFTVNDEFLTEIINKYAIDQNLILKEIHFSNDNPHMVNTTSENTDEDIVSILNNKYFLKWPTIDGVLCEKLCGDLGLEFDEYDDSDTDDGLKEFLEKLQLLEDDLGNLTDEIIRSYFKPIKVYYNDDDYFYGVYEISSSTILMTERSIKEVISMTYEFGSAFNYLDNSILTSTTDLDENGLSMYTAVLNTQYDENSLINAIAIDPVGYGASISNTKWDDKLPQDIDPDAWSDNTLLFNSNGEPIFLCDTNGNNITMRKGLFYGEKGNVYNISHDNLYAQDSIIDIFDGNLIDNKSTFHFYSLSESEIKIWTPFNKVDLTDATITPFRVYRGGVSVSKEDFEANYTLTYSSLYKADLSPYVGLAIEYDGEKLIFNGTYNGDAIVENDTLNIIIKDKRSEASASVTLEVENNSFKVVNTPNTYEAYTSDDALQVTYAINRELSKISIPDNNISGSISKENGQTTLTFTVSKWPEKASIIIYDNEGRSDNLNLDIVKLEPVLYIDRDWTSDNLDIDGINCKVYSEDVDITDRYVITRTNSQIKAVCKYSALSILTKEIKQVESNIKSGDIDYNNKFVYSYGEENTFVINRQKDFLIRGLFGQVILLAPAFKNFKDLVTSLGRMINTDVEEIYNVETADEKISIVDIDTTKISIDHLLDTTAPYLRIKLMPVSSIVLPSDLMNNKDYYTEVGIDDIDFYGYDRVWINENVFMAPPLKIENQYFNAESVAQYTVESWKNKDGYSVYLTNEEGKYIRGFINNHILNYKVIGDEFGNCSQEVYQSVNPRLNPTELIYKTAYDYYYNTYYSSTRRSNPFFRFLKINQNVIGENIIDEIGLYQQLKENNAVVLKKDENFSVINKIVLDLELNKTYHLNDIVDEKKGELNYIITCLPSAEEYSYLAGIKYKNYMYDSDIISDKKYCKVDSDLMAKFAILSKEDVTNTEYKPIVNITEMGIFSKEGYLLAYMHHPIVQYNTKLNHISYNLIIENA